MAELDGAIDAVQAATGSGSAGRGASCSPTSSRRSTADEADFVRRLLTGELRQGALAGLMGDAVAKAADVPGESCAAR